MFHPYRIRDMMTTHVHHWTHHFSPSRPSRSRNRIHDPLRNASMRRGRTCAHSPKSHNPMHSRSHGRTVSMLADRWQQPRRTLPRPIDSPVRASRSDRRDARRAPHMNRL
jgi:hypothetical protein